MNNYVLVTDSACDLPYEYLEKNGILCVDLSLIFDSDNARYYNSEISVNDFYEKLKNGDTSKTSAPNPDEFGLVFENILKQEKDIIYIGLDSALSTTVTSASIAADELSEKYPERKIYVVDSLCASAGEGLAVCKTSEYMKTGKSLEEAYQYAINICPRISHRFTVETLTYLKRGGRIGAASCTIGNMLNIKPVLHVDNEGHLINTAKAHGRAKSLEMLVEAYGKTAEQLQSSDIIISHADCAADAERLASALAERFDAKVSMITNIGPVIGSHAGPGTIALFFIANER